MLEIALSTPIKNWLIAKGCTVHAEVKDCDLVGRADNGDLHIVELKRSLTLDLLVQGQERQSLTPLVWIAIPASAARGRFRDWQAREQLIKRLDLGLLLVHYPTGDKTGKAHRVSALKKRAKSVVLPAQSTESVSESPNDPGDNQSDMDLSSESKPSVGWVEERFPPQSWVKIRSAGSKKRAIEKEFLERRGLDFNIGGSQKRPLMTAYRQSALAVAVIIDELSGASPEQLRNLGQAKGGTICYNNVYGWFEKNRRGFYSLSPQGQAALQLWPEMIALLRQEIFGAPPPDCFDDDNDTEFSDEMFNS